MLFPAFVDTGDPFRRGPREWGSATQLSSCVAAECCDGAFTADAAQHTVTYANSAVDGDLTVRYTLLAAMPPNGRPSRAAATCMGYVGQRSSLW